MNLSNASKVELDNVLNNCGWRQTKQRIVLLKSIFDGTNKHFSINQINDVLKENRSYFSLTTLYENLNTLVDKGYLKLCENKLLPINKLFMILTLLTMYMFMIKKKKKFLITVNIITFIKIFLYQPVFLCSKNTRWLLH